MKAQTKSLHVILDTETHKQLEALIAQQSLASISEAVRYTLARGLSATTQPDGFSAGYKEGMRRAYAKATAALGKVWKEAKKDLT